MNFGGWRGGTAPNLEFRRSPTNRAYVRAHQTCSGTSAATDPYWEQGATALPTAPVFRGQRGKGAGTALTKNKHGYQQPRRGWGKRHTAGRRYNDEKRPMLSTRPASRQAQSDLMDLNLALKFDKMGTQTESRQPKDRLHQNARSTTRGGRRHDRGASAADSPSASRRFSAPVDRYLSQSERYNVEEHASAQNTVLHSAKQSISNQFNEADVWPSLRQDASAQHDWVDGLSPTTPCVAASTTCDTPLMMPPPSRYCEVHSGKGSYVKSFQGKGSQRGRGSCASNFAGDTNLALSSRCSSGTSIWKTETPSVCTGHGYSGERSGEEAKAGVWAELAEEREQGNRSPCQETSSQQSEKDQRMWSALRTSLLSDEGDTDSSIVGFRIGRTDDIGTPGGDSDSSFLKGPRDMEQLDLERSAMDRTMRPHRVASARLLETTQDSPAQAKVKHPRRFSASATRSRTTHNEETTSVWGGAGNTLQCTGVRAELVSRNGDGHSVFCSESPGGADIEGHTTFVNESGSRPPGSHQLARKVEQGRYQWVTNDEGVANFLQRPPSRQKEAFPTHLADVVPCAAFQVEVPLADEEAKQHIETTRKNAVEQTRPPSRHKPPGQSLFLEVPETRRHVPPVFSPSRGTSTHGTESCGALTSGMLSMDIPDVEAPSTTRDTLGAIFTLDRRHDNPDRDGFSVLQVQGPCPFRIEVTNSFMQPQPPTVPVGREAAAISNSRKTTKYCPPDTLCGLFGPVTYDSSGHAGAGKQRAPINTTPTLTGSTGGPSVSARGDTGGKTCAMSLRLLGSRSTGGIAVRSAGTPVSCSDQGEDSTTVDVPSPTPPTRNGNRELTVEARSATLEGGEVRGLREGAVEDGAGRRAEVPIGGNVPSPGRGDTLGLRVNTTTPVVNISDWSLQSCDDADDGAFLDGPASTFGESGSTKHSLLETTLGQVFLSLFAPSSSRDNTSGSRDLQ